MFLPLYTNLVPRRTPWANYILIALNFVVFVATYHPHVVHIHQAGVLFPMKVIVRDWAISLQLFPHHRALWQFVSYAFLHGGWLHIIGNMYFLYIFGNNVNDQLGNVRYFLFYIMGAICGGVGHMLMNPASSVPLIGASGAVSAVTGAYLVMFPRSLITVLYLLFFIGTLELSALWFISFKLIIWDNLIGPALIPRESSVAYNAHLAGYIWGIGSVMCMLVLGGIKTNHVNLWSMLKQWNRRRQYREMVSEGFDPFAYDVRSKRIRVKTVHQTSEQKSRQEKIDSLRQTISSHITAHQLSEAARAYLELHALDAQELLPRQQLLDIANQLASEHLYRDAAHAYERFIEHYASYEYIGQVMYMLGLISARYLQDRSRAVQYLNQALAKLSDPMQIKMCRQELERLDP